MRTLSPSNEGSVNHPTSSSAAKSKLTPKKHARAKENAPPLDPNSLASDRSASPASAVKMKCALPPRPPSSNPLKRKLSAEVNTENGVAGGADSGVKVIVRMRPQIQDEGHGEMTVQKLSDDSLSISGHTFTFDAVADTQASQVDIFELVGAPLVENCLAGFNSSVFAYGQTGSGKTYTMWGPSHALGEDSSLSDQQGLTPRILDCLFNRINEEQSKQTDKQLTYQCRCSFLEIYNEQITDLLDPNQKIVQIREDVKSGIYVENLTEESVSTMKDVQQLLRKGLANRRTGATSINAESSRSHSVFTCIIESRCKSTDGLSSFKSSRINLVDLAGSERQKLTGAAGERLKEAGNINRSLSQLGNLINILAEVSQSGKQRHIPYRDSKLTFLLQESLGGNARLAMICAISPIQSCKSETFSTLRFAQRAKAIKNKAVVNEVMEDDVKVLREVIRQLKDELVRIKATGYNPGDPSGGCRLTGQDVRRSLNLLKLSLRHPMLLPRIDDGDEEMEVEMEVDEEAIENLCAQVGLQFSSSKDIRKSKLRNSAVVKQEMPALSKVVEDSDVKMEEDISEQSDIQINHEPSLSASVPEEPSSADKVPGNSSNSSEQCPDVDPSTLKSPTLSVSPKVVSTSRKSLRTSSMLTASQKDIKFDIDMEPEAVPIPSPKPTRKSSSLLPTQTSRNYLVPTERLAASLNRGLEILDGHRKSTTLRGSAFRFSYKHAELKSMIPVMKVDVGVQTSEQDMEMKTESNEGSNMQMVVHDGAQCSEKPKQVPKAVEKVLAGSFRREMALEEYCANQAAEIKQLNRLVQQYKHERECNAMIAQTKEDKILRLESLTDGVLPPEEFLEEEFASLKHEHKLLKEKYENNPEVQEAKIKSKRLQDELEQYRNFFQLGEKEVLIEEVQDLRFQLQYYIDSSSRRKEEQLLQLRYSREPTSAPPLSIIPEMEENSEKSEETEEDKFEEERKQWTEAESKWISLAEELRSELDSSRSLAEKLKQDLTMEQKCTEELNEAMVSAMQGHARMLENYADLEEKHMQLLARHRKMQQGIEDVKKAAARAGVRGAESKFINSLAAEVSALRMQMEKERQHFRSENRELKAQLEDTAEAVQAAGELLVRLKEAEESVVAAENRAALAAQETQRAYKEIESMRRELQLQQQQQQQLETNTLKKVHPDTSPFHKEDSPPRFDSTEPHNLEDEDLSWRDEFKGLYTNEEQGEVLKLEEPYSWFSGYDRCNI